MSRVRYGRARAFFRSLNSAAPALTPTFARYATLPDGDARQRDAVSHSGSLSREHCARTHRSATASSTFMRRPSLRRAPRMHATPRSRCACSSRHSGHARRASRNRAVPWCTKSSKLLAVSRFVPREPLTASKPVCRRRNNAPVPLPPQRLALRAARIRAGAFATNHQAHQP